MAAAPSGGSFVLTKRCRTLHLCQCRDVKLVRGVKFEIIFPAGKVDAGKFFTVNQVCFLGMCMLSMLRVHNAALAESLQAELCHRLPDVDNAGAQTASQPTVVIRGGGRGYYTLVRLAASLFLCNYDALT